MVLFCFCLGGLFVCLGFWVFLKGTKSYSFSVQQQCFLTSQETLNSWYMIQVNVLCEFSRQDNIEILNNYINRTNIANIWVPFLFKTLVSEWRIISCFLFCCVLTIDDFEVQIQHMTEKWKDKTYESNQSVINPYASEIFNCHWGISRNF